MKKILFLILILIPFVAFGQSEQRENAWDIFSGHWEIWIAQDDTGASMSDTLWINTDADGDTFYTAYFKTWKSMSPHIEVVDTSAETDSVKFIVELLQDGYSYLPDSSRAIITKLLSWKSTTSSTAIDTINAVGFWGVNILSTEIFSYRHSWLRIRTFIDHKKKTGIRIRIAINAWKE